MRYIVEDVLWRHGVLTTDEIYRGVKAKHAQLGRLLPPRWQEEVRQLLEAHCISHEGNSWSLEKLEPLEERPECGASLFEPRGTSERITKVSNAVHTWAIYLAAWFSAALNGFSALMVAAFLPPEMLTGLRAPLGTFLSGLVT